MQTVKELNRELDRIAKEDAAISTIAKFTSTEIRKLVKKKGKKGKKIAPKSKAKSKSRRKPKKKK